jgi:hypothetical protein
MELTTGKAITREQFLKSQLSDISQVYNGKRNCCRCGCKGDYVASSYMANNRSEVNDRLIEKRLARAKRLVEQGADVGYGDTYVDVECGDDRTLTFYFDELKKPEKPEKKVLAIVTARAFNRNSDTACPVFLLNALAVSESRDETIYSDNALFANCATVIDVKMAYEAFWNDLNPKSEDVVFVQSVDFKM